jgi:hypothetical protein
MKTTHYELIVVGHWLMARPPSPHPTRKKDQIWKVRMISWKEANKLNDFKNKFPIDVIASFLCVNLRFFDA